MKAIEQCVPVVLFMLYKVVLSLDLDEFLKCDHHQVKAEWAVLSCGAVYYSAQGGSNFWRPFLYISERKKSQSEQKWDHSEWRKTFEQYSPVVLFIILHKVALTFASVDETPTCDHSNENYRTVLSCATVCFSVFCKINYFYFILKLRSSCE